MSTSPLAVAISYMMDRARTRARAALDGNPESGALTLEWMIIAALIAVAAVAAAALFKVEIAKYTSQMP
jgi:hypothetical protein